MSDFLLNLSDRPSARRILRGLGLPTPQILERSSGPAELRPFAGQQVLLSAGNTPVARDLRAVLEGAGAEVRSDVASADASQEFQAMVFDATALRNPAQCRALYDFFHPLLGALRANARVLVVAACPDQAPDPVAAAVARGVEGFVRSLAKELGKRGATANLIYLEAGAERRLEGPVCFLLSPRSAFISGQPFRISNIVAGSAAGSRVVPLLDKTALVTGAARGLGAAIAQRLAEEGAQVICLDLPACMNDLERTAAGIGGVVLPLDMMARDTPQRLLDFLHQQSARVDIVVHNAGVIRDRTLARMPPENWDLSLGINFDAIVRMDRALLDAQVLNDEGRIVCLSSIAGIAGNVGQTNYALTKAALMGYAAEQAKVLAPRGITVNAVAPGLVQTPMMQSMPFVFREVAKRMNSLSQAGVPRDVAEVVSFLCTPAAVGISGQTIRVCGQNLIGA